MHEIISGTQESGQLSAESRNHLRDKDEINEMTGEDGLARPSLFTYFFLLKSLQISFNGDQRLRFI